MQIWVTWEKNEMFLREKNSSAGIWKLKGQGKDSKDKGLRGIYTLWSVIGTCGTRVWGRDVVLMIT